MSVKEELRDLIEWLPEDKAAILLDELRKYRDVRVAIDRADQQLANGEYTDYDSIQDLTADNKRRGMARLAEERQKAKQ